MDVGTTLEVEFCDRRDGYLKAEQDGNRFSIAGDGSVGDSGAVRVIKKQDNTFIAVTHGALLRLRIDEIIDESTVRANPSYGPVIIPTALTRGDWWKCIVTDVQSDCLVAKPRTSIPRYSDIETGPPPADHTQSLNHLLSQRKL